MATKNVTFGSVGPFAYDDATYHAVDTDGQMRVQTAPTDPDHVARLDDLGDQIAKQAHITHLTDSTSGTANDTVQALTDPADSPASADALRDDLVANLIPALRNNYADLAAKVNALLTALEAAGILS